MGSRSVTSAWKRGLSAEPRVRSKPLTSPAPMGDWGHSSPGNHSASRDFCITWARTSTKGPLVGRIALGHVLFEPAGKVAPLLQLRGGSEEPGTSPYCCASQKIDPTRIGRTQRAFPGKNPLIGDAASRAMGLLHTQLVSPTPSSDCSMERESSGEAGVRESSGKAGISLL